MKMIKISIALLFLLTTKTTVLAQNLNEAKIDVHKLYLKVRDDLYKYSPEPEKRILEKVRLEIIHDNSFFSVYVNNDSGKKSIKLSTGFLSGLFNFILSNEIERETKIEAFAEQAMFEYFQMIRYEKPRFDAFELAGNIQPLTINRIIENSNIIFDNALVSVFAHELGHHATNSFYDQDTLDYEKQAIEKKVDEWALEATLRSKIPITGIVAPLGYFYYYSLIFSIKDSSHDSPVQRISNALNSTIKNISELMVEPQYAGQYSQELLKVINLLNKKADLDQNRTAEFYEDRADRYIRLFRQSKNDKLKLFAGVDYYRAGLILLTGSKKDSDSDKDGFLNIMLASKCEYTPATFYLGFLYEKGIGVEKDKKLAVDYYKIAAKQGFKEAIIKLNSVN